jgi:hypothetical protein
MKIVEHGASGKDAASIAYVVVDKGNLALSDTVRYITNIKSSQIRPRMIQIDFLTSTL